MWIGSEHLVKQAKQTKQTTIVLDNIRMLELLFTLYLYLSNATLRPLIWGKVTSNN